jgi:hypothetical protein
MGPSFVVACQHPPIFVVRERRWDSQPMILTRVAYRRSCQQDLYDSIPYNYALKEFDADDWPP